MAMKMETGELPAPVDAEEFLESPEAYRLTDEFMSQAFDDDTILTLATKQQNVEAVRLLLEAKCDTNKANGKGITPISVAAHKGHTQIMSMLIDAGAHVNALNSSGSTALIQVRYNIDFKIR
jgi:hypothetical protein